KAVVSKFKSLYNYSPIPVGLYWYVYPTIVADALTKAGTLTDESKIRKAISQVDVKNSIVGEVKFVQKAGGIVPVNQADPVLSIVNWSTDGGTPHEVKASSWTRNPVSGKWS